MKIQGTVALVTGGAKGIGRAFCSKLLEHGAASVTLLDISEDEGTATQKELNSEYGTGRANFIRCDATNKENLTGAFTQTFEQNGKLDIVCNNAGINEGKDWQKTIDLNLAAVIHGTFLGLQLMKSGIIVNTASIAGLMRVPWAPVYAASKHGVVGFTRSIAMAATKGVRVNCICPGFTETGLLDPLRSPKYEAILEQDGVISPQLVAEGLVQLIEDDNRNGEALAVSKKRGIAFHNFRSSKM